MSSLRSRTCKPSLEEALIQYCAPTLAGIKCSNLFNYFYPSESFGYQEIVATNKVLNQQGIYLTILANRKQSFLVLVYRKCWLQEILEEENAKQLLNLYDYPLQDLEKTLAHLKKRVVNSITFPHEIGLFLGYPYEDVAGFIKYDGQQFAYCGVWKVYQNVEQRKKLFEAYENCARIYSNAYKHSYSLFDLALPMH